MIMQMMALLFIRAHQQLMGQFCCQSVCFLHRSVNDKSIGKGTFAPDKYAETNTHTHTQTAADETLSGHSGDFYHLVHSSLITTVHQ